MASWLAAVGFKTITLAAGVGRDGPKICNPGAALACCGRNSCYTAVGIHSVCPALVYVKGCGPLDRKLKQPPLSQFQGSWLFPLGGAFIAFPLGGVTAGRMFCFLIFISNSIGTSH